MVSFSSRSLLALVLSTASLLACTSEDGPQEEVSTPDAAPLQGAPDADLNRPDAMPGATLNFMDPCDLADDRCDMAAGDVCFSFNMNGPHCTHSCSGSNDCPAPSRGCNNMGVCKSP